VSPLVPRKPPSDKLHSSVDRTSIFNSLSSKFQVNEGLQRFYPTTGNIPFSARGVC
jgi:hypothetical protein